MHLKCYKTVISTAQVKLVETFLWMEHLNKLLKIALKQLASNVTEAAAQILIHYRGHFVDGRC